MSAHKCAAERCKKQVARDLLMCRTHWFMVPADVRKRIWDGYRRGMDAAYHTAVKEGVVLVARREGASLQEGFTGG